MKLLANTKMMLYLKKMRILEEMLLNVLINEVKRQGNREQGVHTSTCRLLVHLCCVQPKVPPAYIHHNIHTNNTNSHNLLTFR